MSQFNATGPSEFIEAISASVAFLNIEDPRTITVSECNEQFCKMLGVSSDLVVGRPLREFVPRYARADCEANFMRCSEAGATTEFVQPLDMSGQTKWWRIISHPVRQKRDHPSILVTCIDITEKIKLEADLSVVNSRFSAVIESAYDGIVTIDSESIIKIFNSAAEEMFGYEKSEVIGKHLSLLIPERYRSHHGDHINHFQASPIRSRQMFERQGRINGVTKDGVEFPVEISISKIVVNGAQEYTAVIRDVSEQARLIEELHRQAIVDELTGLANRRAFHDKSSELVKAVARSGRPLSVLMIDMDRFKLINDNHGHAVGDLVLQAFAAAGQSCLRKADFFARLGGEEFAIILPGTDQDEAGQIAERLRQTVVEGRFGFEWPERNTIPFTISVGVASWEEGEASIEAALGRADLALYDAKRAGRNCVMIAKKGPIELASSEYGRRVA